MKKNRKKNNFKPLMVVSIVLVLLLLFVIVKTNRQTIENSNSSFVSATISRASDLITFTPPTLTYYTLTAMASLPSFTPPPPTATSTLAPPACTFPLANIEYKESKPEEYTFSEPQVVLNDSYNIVEWLPDNQRLLMTELSDQIEIGKPQTEIIETYNPTTGEIMVYAAHAYADGGRPAWLSELNAVVYPAMNFIDYDKTYHPIFTRQLWVSYGDPDTAQMLTDNMSQFPIAVKSDGREVLYLADKKLFKLDNLLKKSFSTPFDPERWDYGKGQRNQNPIFYKMAWQANTSLVFLYSNGGASEMGGYTFIMDTNTGIVCELNFGGLWVRKALWSLDGRYLAVIRAKDSSGDVFDMAVLDTLTDELHTMEVLPPSIEFKRYIDNFVWAPDGRHLLAVGTASSQGNQNNGDSYGLFELYLVDFIAGQSVSILPGYSGFFTPNLAWSADGTKLAIDCTLNGGYKLCLISVNALEK